MKLLCGPKVAALPTVAFPVYWKGRSLCVPGHCDATMTIMK
jgi:hypothetical protein